MAEWPQRSPLIVFEITKEIISEKTLCHLGCKEGDILEGMNKYAKTLSGIEIDPRHADRATAKGLDVKQGDYFKCEIPEAEVYYMWPHFGHLPKILDRVCFDLKYDCTFMVGFGELACPGKDEIINLQKSRGGYIISGQHNEAGGKYGSTFSVWVVTSEEYRSSKN